MYWHEDSIFKITVMLADKSGLRKKNKNLIKPASKYTQEDVTKMNRQIGIDFLKREEAKGNLTESERAELIRLELKNNG